MKYWLMKSEPSTFSIDDLEKCENQQEPWDGIRNYQARNFMRDEMEIGDLVFFYHSNAKEIGIVGIAEIVTEAYPDFTQFDKDSNYYDPKSKEDNPRWQLVDVKLVKKFNRIITLAELKTHYKELDGVKLLDKGSRLSIIPVAKKHWEYINNLL